MSQQKLLELPPFPDQWHSATTCGNSPPTDWPNARWFPHHAPLSETPPQRRYLGILTKRLKIEPPEQTCCRQQAKALISYLTYKISGTNKDTGLAIIR